MQWKRLAGFRPYGTWYSDSVVVVSVACLFSRDGVASLTPNPPPFSSGLGTGNGGIMCAKSRSIDFGVKCV
ncbi:hypothetical protein [Acinetobacter baumannii]|uniref:hypothetical protein n=1 Tax=Acinetobacter baumannii TaxID=470 RepID=UPI0033996EF8